MCALTHLGGGGVPAATPVGIAVGDGEGGGGDGGGGDGDGGGGDGGGGELP